MDKPKQTFTDLAQDALALEELLHESGGELTPVIEGWMQEITTSLATKVDALAFVLQRIDMNEAFYKQRADECNDMKKKCAKAYDRLKDYIRQNIEGMNTDFIEGDSYKFSVRENPGRLEIIDESLIPQGYKTVVTTIVPDKERIKKDLQDGIKIPGAWIVKEKTVQMRMKGAKR